MIALFGAAVFGAASDASNWAYRGVVGRIYAFTVVA
jgi:hypothetical protein